MILQKLKTLNTRVMPRQLWYAPKWLVLGVNNICNLHCKMCDVGVGYTQSNFYTNLMGSHPTNMPFELMQRIIDQTAQLFPKTKLGFAFTEPLIYPYLIESLVYAHEHGLYTAVTTNALNLKSKADDLVKAGLNDLFISLDGPPEIHNQIRGHKSSFQRAIAGIEALAALPNRPKISIFCCITQWNIGHLEDFLQHFLALPIAHIGFMHTNFTSQSLAKTHNEKYGDFYLATASNMQEINIEAMDLSLLWQEMVSIKQRKYPFTVGFSPEIENENKLHQFYNQPDQFIGKRCHDVFENIMIKSDGTVIPAHGRCYQLTVGNMYEQDLSAIWNSETLGRFRADLNRAGGLLPACARCCSAF